ncbi:MAG TPA: hypothetical protein VHU81_08100, partial [Thermoanaerobaculia bacterium]|nr:hypothetical protein [Thermoanaerobaculia bacterium]
MCRTRRAVPLLLSLFLAVVLTGFSDADAATPAAAYSYPVPSRLVMTVRETAGIARTQEVVRSGVPLPRSLNVVDTSRLAVIDPNGAPVPAEFRVLARWNAGRSGATPIQWLMVAFPASVGARASASYTLVTNGSVANPAPSRPLTLIQSGNAFTVDTGAAIFRFGAGSGALFDEVVLDNGTRLVGGSAMTMRANGANGSHSTTRRAWIEQSGPLSAVVVVEGAYGLAAVGTGGFATTRRYVFTWGSPTAVVRHVVKWEGTLDSACPGCIIKNGVVNGVLVEQVRDALNVELGGTPTVTAVGAFDAPAVEAPVALGKAAWVRQLLRPSRSAPMQLSVQAGATATGGKADGGLLAAAGPRGAVAVGLAQMHRYEPQALRLLEDGRLAVDLADGTAWLSHHQGMFATLAVTALPQKPSRADLDRLTWAPLNRPLHAWPEAAWFASSDAVEEFPVGALPADLASYDTLLPKVLSKTYQEIDRAGIPGLMTYGV